MKSIPTRPAALGAALALTLAGLAGTLPAGAHDGDPHTDWSEFDKVTLTSEVGEPMSMAVLPDRRVLHTNRQGQIRLYDPQTATTEIITSLPVYDFSEDGMQGIAVDPNFEENNWVYVYYAPEIEGFPEGGAPEEVEPGGDTSVFDEYEGKNVLSRFEFVDDPADPYIDLDSEQVILEVPTNRGMCCHVGGDIDFDSAGNLYVATGDDTNPFQSNGYTPIDERPYRNPAFDAQRTSANTADLRGKLLRITPLDEPGDEPGLGSTYTVPEDNMFNSGEWNHLFPDDSYDPELARPEIYAMGFRNPFRFTVDPETDAVYIGDYGPDANEPDPDRGPRATVEWVIVTEPRNHGWPYCNGPARPFVDYDFETGESSEPFDCANPVNESPNNTGLEQLPPVTPAEVWYENGVVTPEFPELGSGGGAPMGGPAYSYDADVAAEFPTAFPEEFDGIPLMYEWSRNYVKQMVLDENGDVAHILDFLPDADWHSPMDMEFGPDGSLYILEYGGGFFVEHPEAKLSRVDYVANGRTPAVRVDADERSGHAPLEVEFSSEGTHHPEDAEIVEYHWDFDDGSTSSEQHPTHTFTQDGVYAVTLTVTDEEGRTGRAGITIVVGNTAPEVIMDAPVDGGFFHWGDEAEFRIRVSDPEDGAVDCSAVRLNAALGHDDHAHPMGEYTGCAGTVEIPPESGHDDDMNLYWVLSTRYTDLGHGDLPPLSGTDQAELNPARKQAQFFADASGVETARAQDAEEGGATRLTGIDHGDWTAYEPVNFLNIDGVDLRVRSDGPGGTIELRKDAPDGPVVGSADVPDTNGEWTFVDADISDPGETFTLYMVFAGPDGSGSDLFDVNFFDVDGEGVAGPLPPLCEGTITFGDSNSGVADRQAGAGCVGEILDDGRAWRNHGAFVSHVSHETDRLVDDGVLTSQERSVLIRTAAGSDVGKRR